MPVENRLVVFVSSVTGEQHLESLDTERDRAEQVIEGMWLAHAWKWEHQSANTRRAPEVYLSGVRRADIFVMILGKDVTQPVMNEYEEAVKDPQKPILVFVKLDTSQQKPEERMSASAKSFLSRIAASHTYVKFVGLDGLETELTAALGNELTETCRRFWKTPASRKEAEGADRRVLLLGAGELGLEIARSLRRYSGNRVVLQGIDRYGTPPARDELHSLTVVSELPWSEDRLLGEISRLVPKPEVVLPEIMAAPPGLFRTLEKHGYSVVPKAQVLERLLDRVTYRLDLDNFLLNRSDVRKKLNAAKVELPRWQTVRSADEVNVALTKFGGKLFLKPSITDLGLGQSFIDVGAPSGRTEAIHDAWEHLSHARYGGPQDALVEQFIPFDTELYQVVIRASGVDTALDAVEYKRNASPRDAIGGPWQLDYSVQPPILDGRSNAQKKSIQNRLRECSLILLREWLDSDGFFGFEYFLDGDQLWLNKVTFRPDINGIVTVYSSKPSIFDVYAKMVLGHPLPVHARVTPAACCPKLWPDLYGAGVRHRYVIDNINQVRGPNLDVFPIDKHEGNARDRVAFVVAFANGPEEALRLARAGRDQANVVKLLVSEEGG